MTMKLINELIIKYQHRKNLFLQNYEIKYDSK